MILLVKVDVLKTGLRAADDTKDIVSIANENTGKRSIDGAPIFVLKLEK
jgi:hypothetical protein